jgi:molybdopterin biosynthesis enzyme
MIFTIEEWNLIQQEKMAVSAAPIKPTELGRNANYYFALPARYNYAFISGYEEVEEILKERPLVDANWTKVVSAVTACKAKTINQNHSNLVSVELKDGSEITAYEPIIDAVINLAVGAEKGCGKIIMATE